MGAAACRGQLAAPLLPARCPSNIRMSVRARLPIPAAALRAYHAKNRLKSRLGFETVINSRYYRGTTQIDATSTFPYSRMHAPLCTPG